MPDTATATGFRSRSDVQPTYTVHPRQPGADGQPSHELAPYRISLRRVSPTLWRGCVRWLHQEDTADEMPRRVQLVEAYADTLAEAVRSVCVGVSILQRSRASLSDR